MHVWISLKTYENALEPMQFILKHQWQYKEGHLKQFWSNQKALI